MELSIGHTCHGFSLKHQRRLEELNSRMHLFEHEKSGARLAYIENDDDNKVFSITFRTPPPDSTGVPHILEHSVLCGSRKFPLKEPFVELVKGSLNTFLNAMTFADKTMYPVASRNDVDFFNLMDVYLDAVFFPLLYTTPETLMQEGWHYHIEKPEDPITLNGVVYNEMKGVFSSPEALLERKIQESLFPETPYGVESGGDPEYIPDLTQEEFEKFHRTYYHPANSYIFLYGNLDIDKALTFIDQEYLSKFDRIKVDSRIKKQRSFSKPHVISVEYPVSSQASTAGKTFLSMNYVIGTAVDPELCLAADILKHMLLDTPAAPLKKALLDAGLGKDVYGSFDDSILQPVFSIIARNAEQEGIGKFRATVNETLKALVKQGINKKLIESSINIREFQLREANFANRPKGLIYNIKAMNSWLYDEDPALHLAYEESLARIKTALTKPYFEHLIEKYMLKNTHCSSVALIPKPGLQEERTRALAERLTAYKAGLSREKIQALIAKTQTLQNRQTTPDREETLETIPLLQLKDINPKAEYPLLAGRQECGIKVLWHELYTNHISYVNMYFNAEGIDPNQNQYLFLLAGMLGKIGTESFSYADLSNEINIHTGGIQYKPQAFTPVDAPDGIRPMFIVKAKALDEKSPRLFLLLGEILNGTRFDDARRLRELIHEMKAQWEAAIIEAGQTMSAGRLLSYFSPAGRFNEAGLLSFYEFLTELESADMIEVGARLADLSKRLFNKNSIMVSIASDQAGYQCFAENIPPFVAKLSGQTAMPAEVPFKSRHRNEGLMTPGKIQFVAKGGNFVALGYQYTGAMKVLETILRYDYLWNTVRVKGGAYGGYAAFDRGGNMVLGSYRDPNLAETISVFDKTSEYLSGFSVNDREMTKYIIGTMSGVDMPLTPPLKAERAVKYYLEGVSREAVQSERDEILATRQQDIQRLAAVVSDVMRQNYVCVLGNEHKIRENEQLFKSLVDIFA